MYSALRLAWKPLRGPLFSPSPEEAKLADTVTSREGCTRCRFPNSHGGGITQASSLSVSSHTVPWGTHIGNHWGRTVWAFSAKPN